MGFSRHLLGLPDRNMSLQLVPLAAISPDDLASVRCSGMPSWQKHKYGQAQQRGKLPTACCEEYLAMGK